MSIIISAVICTYNRAQYLRRAIKSLVRQTAPKTEYEIIVIDNASTDETKNVVLKEFCNVQNLRYVHEPILGISQSRNSGCGNARGAYISYLDDDAIASRDWIERITTILKASKSNLGCLCGRILPIWESPRPSWLSQDIEYFLGLSNVSDQPSFVQVAPSCNSTYLRELLKEIGGYDTSISGRGRSLVRGYGEDDLLFAKIIKKGHKCLYDPRVVVSHHIPKTRLTKKYFICWAFGSGVAQTLIYKRSKSPTIRDSLKKCLSLTKGLLLSPKRVYNLATRFSKPKTFSKQCIMAMDIGKIAGFLIP